MSYGKWRPFCLGLNALKKTQVSGPVRERPQNFVDSSWWRHQMETFSALLAICAGNSSAPGEFSAQRPVTQSFDVFFDLCLNKRLRKQSWGWWFETLSHPLWRHYNVLFCIHPWQAIIRHSAECTQNESRPLNFLSSLHFSLHILLTKWNHLNTPRCHETSSDTSFEPSGFCACSTDRSLWAENIFVIWHHGSVISVEHNLICTILWNPKKALSVTLNICKRTNRS